MITSVFLIGGVLLLGAVLLFLYFKRMKSKKVIHKNDSNHFEWLYIEKGDSTILSKKYHRLHNICVDMYDLMVSFGHDSDYKELTVTHFPLTKEERASFDAASKEGMDSVLDYLAKTDRKPAVVMALAKNVFSGVLADALSFLYESLSSARKGKMSVAFNLLRKPITDELLILEQLVYDKDDFIERFHFIGDPEGYDPSSGNPRINVRDIVNNAIERTKTLSPLFTHVYEFRYDKGSEIGLNWITQHAHHIVAMDKKYKTANKSLNFVFSDPLEKEPLWDRYYKILPYLMVYMSCIADTFAHENIQVSSRKMVLRKLRQFLAFIYWGQEVSKASSDPGMFGLMQLGTIICSNCQKSSQLVEADFKLFYETGYFPCPGCLENLLEHSNAVDELKKFFQDDKNS